MRREYDIIISQIQNPPVWADFLRLGKVLQSGDIRRAIWYNVGMKHNLKIFTENVEAEAVNQIYNLITQEPFLGQQVRIMPDVHCGMGCVVGFTSTMGDKIIPNVIGVDIGCGMFTAELGKIDVDYRALDEFIKQNIPAGANCRKEADGEDIIKSLRCFKELRNFDRLYGSLGTLGGGNHFIEVDADVDGNKYLVIHSGSRNLGMQVAKIYQKRAVEACKNAAADEREQVIAQLKSQGRQGDIPQALAQVSAKYAYKTKIPADLCYLEGTDMQNYMHDMRLCQQFAVRNRKKMADLILKHLKVFKCVCFETVHNFIDEYNIVRKGAISARKGQKVIIPMNMRDGCLICTGKGNGDWNQSAPHGAGRLYSRSESKQRFTVEEFADAMRGIYTTTANVSTLDESPMAYKPMQEILSLISDTVEVIKIIKPQYNFKASEGE